MSAWVEKAEAGATGRKEIGAKFAADEGLDPHQWGNAPNYEYDRHSHGYHKVLYCVSGSIVFHTEDGDFELKPGDRLDVEPGTEHAATVGPDGVQCMETHAVKRLDSQTAPWAVSIPFLPKPDAPRRAR